jgi:hypothetical protein
LSWPQVGRENREVRLIQKGQHHRTIPLDRRDEAILRPRAPDKTAVFMVAARPGAQKPGEVIRAGATGWNAVPSGFTTRAAPPPTAWTDRERCPSAVARPQPNPHSKRRGHRLKGAPSRGFVP